MPVHGEHAGAARVRRERKLRSFWRHEQMAIQMVLASVQHHSFGKVGTTHAALRGQKQGTRTVQGEEHELYHTAKFRTTPLPAGGRPAPLSEVAGWQVKVARHTGQLIDDLPYVQILDTPVPQMVDSAMEFFRRLDLPVAEQVIDVPFSSSSSSCPTRATLPEPQLVEQLVEVPTVLSVAVLQQRTAEQFGSPVPGRGGGARGGLQGFSQGQGSTAVCGADFLDIPAPHGCEGGSRGGFQGLSQGQGSTAVCGDENVVSPGGGLHGLSQGQGSTAVCGAENVVSPGGGLHGLSQVQGSTAICEAVNVDTPARGGLQGLSQGQGSAAVSGAVHVDTPARGGVHGLSQGQGSTAVYGAEHVDTPVPQGRVGKRDLQGFPRGQSSTASAGEQSIIPACGGLQGLPQGQGSAASAGERTIVPSRGDEVKLLFRKTTESRPQLRVHARKTRPLHFAFKAYCRRFGLQESQVRFYCDGLLSPEHSPGLLGLEDGDVIEAEEVFEEDDDEDEEDEDMDELDGTQSRFPDGFLPMRLCRWFPSGNCRQGWGCMFAHSVSELHPLSHEHDL